MKNHNAQKPLAEFYVVLQKRIPEFVALAFALLVVGCGAATQAEIPLSSVAKEIETRGYRVQKRSSLPPDDWEISEFRLRNKVAVTFKAEKRLPNETDNYYCRFILLKRLMIRRTTLAYGWSDFVRSPPTQMLKTGTIAL